MKSLRSWWSEYRETQRQIREDAACYHCLLHDIRDVANTCGEFSDVEATALWLLRNDRQRRWRPGDEPLPAGKYWGPIKTFRDQLMIRRNQRREGRS